VGGKDRDSNSVSDSDEDDEKLEDEEMASLIKGKTFIDQ